MSEKIPERDQILHLIPTARFGSKLCSSCREPAECAIESGLTGPSGASTVVLALCNVCLSRLRELITAYEHAEPEKRDPLICLNCQHNQGAHYRTDRAAGCGIKGCDCSGFVREVGR